jgi:uncharacterized protein YbjT (DUF2867 family)
MTVVVAGATGNVGSALVHELQRRDALVRAFVRDSDKAEVAFGKGIELSVGDFADRATIEVALKGADKLFIACANDPRQVEFETNVIDVAADSSIEHVVKLSALGAEIGSRLDFWDWQGRIEQHLEETTLQTTILRPHNYMSGLLASAGSIRHSGKIFGSAGNARIPMIDPRDVAAVAAVALTQDGHRGKRYTLTGPEAFTFGEVAQQLSQVTGRQIDFVNLSDEEALDGLLEAGMPDWLATNLVTLFKIFKEEAEPVTDTVYDVTGSAPRTLKSFLEDHKGAFE